jgi:hypothetical protein
VFLCVSVCHPSVIFLRDAFEDPFNLFLVLEFASEAELFRHIAVGKVPVYVALNDDARAR